MGKKHLMDIPLDELKERLLEKNMNFTDAELSAIKETISDWHHEQSEDGLLTLVSFRWKNPKGKYVKISIPW